MCPGRRNVEGLNLGTLIRGAQRSAGQGIQFYDAIEVMKFLVVRVGSLKPGTGVTEIQVQRVVAAELVVHAVKDVLFVTVSAKDDKLWRVEKPPGIQSTDRDEVAPTLSAIRKVGIDV